MLFLNQRKRKNGRRNISMTKYSRKDVPDARIDRGFPLISKQHRYRPSYSARLYLQFVTTACSQLPPVDSMSISCPYGSPHQPSISCAVPIRICISIYMEYIFVCLFGLRLYVPVNNFQSCRDGATPSFVLPVLFGR